MKRLEQIEGALTQEQQVFDYIIVGAGISGLQSAEILTQKPGTKLLILQAQREFGGRIGSLSVGDLEEAKRTPWISSNIDRFRKIKIEKGATWIQEQHHLLRRLCKDWGLTLANQYSEGDTTWVGRHRNWTPSELLTDKFWGPAISRTIKRIDELADEYNREVGLNGPRSKQLLALYDSMTVEEFLKRQVPQEEVRQIFDTFFQHTECAVGHENSAHELLFKHARSNDMGILKEFLGAYGHEPSYLLEGGTEKLLEKMIERLEANLKDKVGSILRLGQQVLTIDNRDTTLIRVVTENIDGRIIRYRAKRVICAIPLAVSRQVLFTNLSKGKKYVMDNQIRTNAVKSFLIVRRPFWRRDANGLPLATGDALYEASIPVNMSHDISPQDQSCGIMVFFHNGRKLDEWERKFGEGEAGSAEKRKQFFVNLLARMYNLDEATKKKQMSDCIYYGSSYMANRFIRSGFQSNTRPGTFTRLLAEGDGLQALYRDEPGITFVGSEYSLRFASYIEGSLRITRNKIHALAGLKDPYALTPTEESKI